MTHLYQMAQRHVRVPHVGLLCLRARHDHRAEERPREHRVSVREEGLPLRVPCPVFVAKPRARRGILLQAMSHLR